MNQSSGNKGLDSVQQTVDKYRVIQAICCLHGVKYSSPSVSALYKTHYKHILSYLVPACGRIYNEVLWV